MGAAVINLAMAAMAATTAEALRDLVQRLQERYALPPFPSQGLVLHTPELMEERQRGLAEYLEQIRSIVPPSDPVLAEFLGEAPAAASESAPAPSEAGEVHWELLWEGRMDS